MGDNIFIVFVWMLFLSLSCKSSVPDGLSASVMDRSKESSVDATKIHMTKIRASTFQMGCTKEQISDCDIDERPVHKVLLNRNFLIGTYEVTQGLYERIMGDNPSFFSSCGTRCPVENVSWYDAIAFTNALNDSLGLQRCYTFTSHQEISFVGITCRGYRLPTETEWEYVARSNQDFIFSGGQEIDLLAWYINNSFSQTHPVGQKIGNRFGIFDMSGNVLEWVWDWKKIYKRDTKRNPTGPEIGEIRVARGGSWAGQEFQMRVTYRYSGGFPNQRENFIGFRLAKSE
jgi:formylglycine-generating enzyme required for sulfatase activity